MYSTASGKQMNFKNDLTEEDLMKFENNDKVPSPPEHVIESSKKLKYTRSSAKKQLTRE